MPLDPINNPQDRPQFFQAHGTGTQAGDPQEAEAISNALFPEGSRAALSSEKLLVGSIKTVVGHTEGTAGLASVISTSLALKHGIVPPIIKDATGCAPMKSRTANFAIIWHDVLFGKILNRVWRFVFVAT